MNLYTKIILYIVILFFINLIFFSIFTNDPYILIENIVYKISSKKKSIKKLLKQENNIELPCVKEKDEIPKIIFQTHKKKELVPDYYIKNLKKLNRDWEYRFFDDQEAKKFLREEFGKEFEDKFNYFNSGPHKVDLWRLCVLYKYGGVYMDVDVEMYKSFDFVINKLKDDLIIAETIVGFNNKRIFNAIMFCKPGDKLIGECIKRIMLVENKYLDKDYFYILYIMSNILQEKLKKNKLFEKYRPSNKFKALYRGDEYYLFINEEKIAKSKREDYVNV